MSKNPLPPDGHYPCPKCGKSIPVKLEVYRKPTGGLNYQNYVGTCRCGHVVNVGEKHVRHE